MTNKVLEKEFANVVTTCFQQLVASCGADGWAAEAQDAHQAQEKFPYVGVIGFSGDSCKGSLSIGCHEDFLKSSHPTASMGADVSEDDIADWLGEIANQHIGRIKNAVIPCGVDFSLSSPTVLRGQNIQIKAHDKLSAGSFLFSSKSPIFLYIEIELPENVDWSAAKLDADSGQDSGVAAEGDALLF